MENTAIVHRAIACPITRRGLIALATRLLRSVADAEDCVQDALLSAARNAHTFEGRACPRTWLGRIVRNACLMFRRSRRRVRRGGELVQVPLEDWLPARASTPEDTVIARAMALEALDELARVPRHDAELFERALFEDRSFQGLADDLGATRQAVKSRVFRVRRRLAERLEVA